MFFHNTTKTIETNNLGRITIRKNRRSKHISIRVKPHEGISITTPTNVSMSYVEKLIESKSEWIKQKLEKINKLEKSKTIFDLNTKFQTRNHRLVINLHDKETTIVRVSNGLIMVKYPCNRIISDKDIQRAIREGIDKALRIEAQEYIPHRVKGLAGRFDLKYKDVTVKNIKTRWGSCSSKNNLNFNIHLMMLPVDLIDYVIVHELAHTVEKNHSHRFWSLLDSLVGDSKKLNRDLKKYRIGIF
ncbi:MAG: SprT family zinc-dependent metalloprotease [Proteobacteria bacterium]|nr:SprT family zinc-dependent metalloprotease [Pseudomonadota bacterium]